MEEKRPKIRAVLLWLEYQVRAGLPGDEEANGPEWFKDPARDIKILRVLDTSLPDRNLPADEVITGDEHLSFYCRTQIPPIEYEEILIVTDMQFARDSRYRRMNIMYVGHRGVVTIEKIIKHIYLVEHAKTGTVREP